MFYVFVDEVYGFIYFGNLLKISSVICKLFPSLMLVFEAKYWNNKVTLVARIHTVDEFLLVVRIYTLKVTPTILR